ncbi:MAG: LolA family protein [Phycisphaerae bacterium]
MMRARAVTCVSIIGLIITVSNGQTSGEAGPPASCPTTGPASQPAPLDPAVEKILDRLENKDVRDVQADLVYIKKDSLIDYEQKYKGILRFIEDKPSPRFLIRFDECIVEGVVEKEKEWHVFDGRWYIEARERSKQVIKREVVGPGEKAEDLFRIGKGPFPMPFGQKKGDIVRHFTIKLVASGPSDPPNTDHLECTPLPGTDLDRRYGKVHFHIDRTLDVPVRVATVAKEDKQEIIASFSNVRLNKGMAASEVNLPNLPGYEVREEPMADPAFPPASNQ